MTDFASQVLSKTAIVIPTWNSERYFDFFVGPLLAQGIDPAQVLIIDSESSDGTIARARSFGFTVHQIRKQEFNHGGTRGLAAGMLPWAEFLVYTTHDAIMEGPDTLRTLLAAFQDPEVGGAYGRQLPHADADAFARFHCAMNYPAQSMVRDFESHRNMGFKGIYFSDNFGAFRHTALESVGGFPKHIITAEDFYLSARMMMEGWKTAYVAEAAVYHSHNLGLLPLFRRFFDIGVMHAQESWILDQYGSPKGTGLRFILAEVKFLLARNPLLVPVAAMRTLCKYTAYQLGKREAMLTPKQKRRMGGFKQYWDVSG